MQRTKGKAGEREVAAIIADLTGWQVRRRVRQHEGDSDLEGVPGWSLEVKRHRAAAAGDIGAWWLQAVAQAGRSGATPLLLYRADRAEWRARWPLALLLTGSPQATWRSNDWTADTTVAAWAAVARELQSRRDLGRPLESCP
jgi:hypothetical protein